MSPSQGLLEAVPGPNNGPAAPLSQTSTDLLGSEPKFTQPEAGPAGATHGVAVKLVSDPNKSLAGLSALCAIARFHQVAADPATLAHQLGLSGSDSLSTDDLLRAAQHLGLKAKLSRSSPERLALTPLPALALMRSEDDSLRVVVLAQSDGQRVLFQAGLGGGYAPHH